jgi:nucleoside-diphosphate-sugar epimerase
MKIFVTGGTGFIGSHVLNQAIVNGHEIVATRRTKNSKTRVTLSKEPIWIDKELPDINVDDLAGSKVLLHLAAHSANVPYDNLATCLYWNLVCPLQLLEKALLAGIKHFVIAGTCFEYGESSLKYDFIPPTAALEPTQTYPASKACASIAFLQWSKEKNVSLSIQRIFQVYGEGEQQSRLWPSLKEAAMSGSDYKMTKGEQVRDFIHVSKVASRLVERCETLATMNNHIEVQNLGSGKPMTIRQFAEDFWQEWSAKGSLLIGELPYRQGEVMRYVPLVPDDLKNNL